MTILLKIMGLNGVEVSHSQFDFELCLVMTNVLPINSGGVPMYVVSSVTDL